MDQSSLAATTRRYPDGITLIAARPPNVTSSIGVAGGKNTTEDAERRTHGRGGTGLTLKVLEATGAAAFLGFSLAPYPFPTGRQRPEKTAKSAREAPRRPRRRRPLFDIWTMDHLLRSAICHGRIWTASERERRETCAFHTRPYAIAATCFPACLPAQVLTCPSFAVEIGTICMRRRAARRKKEGGRLHWTICVALFAFSFITPAGGVARIPTSPVGGPVLPPSPHVVLPGHLATVPLPPFPRPFVTGAWNSQKGTRKKKGGCCHFVGYSSSPWRTACRRGKRRDRSCAVSQRPTQGRTRVMSDTSDENR